ncbi:MAG: formimidoylglutamate deiminase [Sinimarinibacterium flocculans]|uniref:formimidoylglutamate deiminase n=1 Tax=Sinimarinibacterium flocculans TaxID=985250 RepID=UPI003C5C1FE1
MSQALFAAQAWLPDGWAQDVRVDIGDDGLVSGVAANAPADGAERLAGPLIPGMPNLHSHAFQRAMAGLTGAGGPQGDNFWAWRACMYRFLERLTPDDLEAIAAQLYVEMLERGYTTVGEFHYLHHDIDGRPYADPAETALRVVAAAGETGIGLRLLPVFYAHAGFGGEPPADGQRRFVCDLDGYARLAERCAQVTAIGFAPHSLRAVTPDELQAILALRASMSAQAPVHIHAAEQTREVDDCLEWSGQRPVEWLLWNAPLDRHWCLVHATHMRELEAAALASHGAVAGLCPSTEADLGDGLFNAEPFLLAGGHIGIGGDSHVGTDPFAELRLFEYGQRLVRRRRNLFERREGRSVGAALYRAAASGGAQALGFAAGAIAPGLRADLVVLDPDDPALAGHRGDRWLDAAIFGPARRPVRDVMVGGRWRMRDGRHPQAEATFARYRATLRRLVA